MRLWTVPRAKAPVRGTFSVPPSKSLHQRALALAVLADGTSVVEAAGEPPLDTRLFAEALSRLAGRPVPAVGPVEGAFSPEGLGASRASLRLDLGMNATGLRIATALACLRPEGARTLLTGAPRLRARPVRPLLFALARLGGHARRRPSGAVRVLGGGLEAGRVAMRGDVSSQFATALLLAAPRFGGVSLTLVGEPVSAGYLRLTLEALERFGVRAERSGRAVVVPGQAPRAARVRVEGDASTAAVWWTAAALTGGDVTTTGVPAASAQPDLALLPIVARMGAEVSAGAPDAIRVRGPASALRGAGDVDLRGAPDLAALVAVLACGAQGTTRVVHAPHLRFKESDRVEAVVSAVRAVGGEAREAPDGFEVRGRALSGGVVEASGDHRIVLAFGALGLVVPVRLAGAAAVAKSYPAFPGDLAAAAGA
jgi:3-phosphoshikimate 1-carboxyvinyltransferase